VVHYGAFSVELSDADIEKTLQSAHGVTGQFLTGYTGSNP
jgi:hypothetical protein